MLHLIAIAGLILALIVGAVVGRGAGKTIAVIAGSILLVMVVTPILILTYMGVATEAKRQQNTYEPPPGTPTSITFQYKLRVTVEADGKSTSGDALQMLTATANSNPTGLGDRIWKAGGQQLRVPAGDRTVFDSMLDGSDYARQIIDACVPRKSYGNFAQLAARVEKVESCTQIDPRVFLRIKPYPKPYPQLPLDQRYLLPNVIVTDLVVTPLRRGTLEADVMSATKPPPIATPQDVNSGGFVVFK